MDIRNSLKSLLPEVDYQSLMAQLPPQSHPRRKLKELQTKGYLIRLKKGFYVLTDAATNKEYSIRIAANLLYGPSYLSLEFALQYHRLIPERVLAITSVTTQKNKVFATPIGSFTYHHLHPSLYVHGVTLQKEQGGRNFLIAKPEKALLDVFTLKFSSAERPERADLVQALYEDLRIDSAELKRRLDRKFLNSVRFAYRNRRWCLLLIDYLLELS